MAWIKRNLYFVLGSLVAVALMGAGGFYLYSKISEESSITEEIKKLYSRLNELNAKNPHPGSGDIDNIKAAKEQEQMIKACIGKMRPFFQPCTPIPDMPKVGKEEFAAQMRTTIAELWRDATNSSVNLPHEYKFTFEAQFHRMNFDPASLDKLAAELGEIKTLSEIIFAARVNALDSVRREIISQTDDDNAPDYLADKTVSVPLADITPYELSFRCFSQELAAVLSGLANSPHCFIVKTINVEPAPAAAVEPVVTSAAAPAPAPVPQQPVYNPYPTAGGAGYDARYNSRYGTGTDRYGHTMAPYPQPVVAAPAAAAPPANKHTTFLDEHELRVTLMIEVVKLKP